MTLHFEDGTTVEIQDGSLSYKKIIPAEPRVGIDPNGIAEKSRFKGCVEDYVIDFVEEKFVARLAKRTPL